MLRNCAYASRACETYQVALDVEVTNKMNQVPRECPALGLCINHLSGSPTECIVFEARNNLVQRRRCVAWIELGDHGCETCFKRHVVCDHVFLLQESVRGEEL